MYFDEIPLFQFKKYFDTAQPFYAHLKNLNQFPEEKETLEDHLTLAISYLLKLISEKNLDPVFKNFENKLVHNLSAPSRLFWRELFVNAIYTHDLGKTNPNFQFKKMDNKDHPLTLSNNSRHSFFSALIYCNHYLNKMRNFQEEDHSLLFLTIILNSYVISKHHSILGNFSDFLDELSKSLVQNKNEHCCYYNEDFHFKDYDIQGYFWEQLSELKESNLWQSIPWVIYGRFLFGLLVSCDFYATSDYMHYSIENFGCIKDIHPYRTAFNSTQVFKNIQKYFLSKSSKEKNPFDETPMNSLRSDLFLEAEKNLLKNLHGPIHFLEAPTGSGKTNTSINLALNLLETNPSLNKITYVFPFNTLVEQTKESLSAAFNCDETILNGITVVNGITSIKKIYYTDDGEWDFPKDGIIDYEQSLLGRQFLHYPIVLTTHVNFFNILFGTNRESVFPLVHLANSVIILDEVQSYPNHLWKEIILFCQNYGKLLNFKIIIMSATLPDLGLLSFEDKVIPKLIENPQIYYRNPLFKNRVLLDFSLLKIKKENLFQELLKKVFELTIALKEEKKYEGMKNKIVVAFIFKSSALEFFRLLENTLKEKDLSRKILCITGDDNKAERKRIINEVNTSKDLILIATQVIEAGVDIDMDMGLKDISIFDAEEQFLGRINRSCSKTGSTVFFFNYNDASLIYRNDLRKEENLTKPELQALLKEKDFPAYYKPILEKLNLNKAAHNDNNISEFAKNTLWQFDYLALESKMKLITDEQNKISVFICQAPTLINDQLIDSVLLWERYKALLMNSTLSYSQKRVELSDLYEEMDYFIYTIPSFYFTYQERIGELFCCDRQEDFFPNNKFDSIAFKAYFENNLFF